MDIKEFISNFAEQFDDLDAEKLTPQTEFMALDDWNSLVALSVIAMIDEEYDVTLKGNDIREAKTLEGLFNTVCKKMD